MDQQGLKNAAQQGNIDALYDSIEANPNILKTIDEIPFVDTPLHIAAAAGHIHFALEMMRLMPSFARKLNQDGYSPIHLALKKDNNTRMVFRLVNVDPDLVRVKGREGQTPLHYVAAKDGLLDVLAEFLVVCPDSIQDLTLRDETALHIALKKNMFGAFDVLMGWLQRGLFYKQDSDLKNKVLNWKDEEGNTLLHIATFNNQPKVVRLLIKNKVDVNARNLEDKTALDILQSGRRLAAGEMKDMLQSAKGKMARRLPKIITIADYLRSKMRVNERFFWSNNGVSFMSSENRSAILVVAVLIATATFQAGLNPPGGLQQVRINHNNSSSYGNSTNTIDTIVGVEPQLWSRYYCVFQFTNSTAFFASMGLIILLFPVTFAVLLVEYSLIACYFFSVAFISPDSFTYILLFLLFIPIFSLGILMFKNPARLPRYCDQIIRPNFPEKERHPSSLYPSSLYGRKINILIFLLLCLPFILIFSGAEINIEFV